MTKKTIRHAIFSFADEVGQGIKTAFHGETVDIPKKADVVRGEKLGAFFDRVGQEADRVGELQPLPADASDEQLKAYVAAGTTPEILAQARNYSSTVVARLRVLEQQRIGTRELLVDGLTDLLGTVPTPDPVPETPSTPDPDDGASDPPAPADPPTPDPKAPSTPAK